jgi:hypothetical protein
MAPRSAAEPEMVKLKVAEAPMAMPALGLPPPS